MHAIFFAGYDEEHGALRMKLI